MKNIGKPASGPKVKLLFLKDFRPPIEGESPVEDLRLQLAKLPEFRQTKLQPRGNSMVLAFVPALNTRQVERLKLIAGDKLKGWRLVDEQSYNLPTTF